MVGFYFLPSDCDFMAYGSRLEFCSNYDLHRDLAARNWNILFPNDRLQTHPVTTRNHSLFASSSFVSSIDAVGVKDCHQKRSSAL